MTDEKNGAHQSHHKAMAYLTRFGVPQAHRNHPSVRAMIVLFEELDRLGVDPSKMVSQERIAVELIDIESEARNAFSSEPKPQPKSSPKTPPKSQKKATPRLDPQAVAGINFVTAILSRDAEAMERAGTELGASMSKFVSQRMAESDDQ